MFIYKSNLSCDNFITDGGEYAKRYLGELEAEYNELLKTDIPPLTHADFEEFSRSGKRLGYENKYFLRRKMLRDFGLKLWLGSEDAAAPLEKIIAAICSETTWALPAHCISGKTENTIDLFAAETAQSLCEIISLTGDKLQDKIKTDAVNGILRRVLEPFAHRTEKYGWETSQSNWSAVCGGSVGMTALYLVEDKPECKKMLAPLESAFKSYMKSFSDDGACLEGLYYWGYGMTYLTAFLELYKERMGEPFPIDREKLAKMADFARKCCVTDGITVSFSDSGERDRIYSGLSSRLTELYGAKPIPYEYRAYLLGDDCGRWCRAARDIAWTRENGNAESEKSSILPDAQWAVVRGENIAFAIKGGGNGEPHNHNDIGSFMVVKNGKTLFCDLGAGEYTREYFSDGRYSVFCCSSLGHSVPIINGQPQKNGREYAAGDFVVGELSAEVDISGAYGIDALKKCIRKIECTDGQIVLTDTYELTKPAQITERFITRDAGCAARLKTDNQCEIVISGHKHREHDGTVTEVTVIDFTFEADGETIFSVNLH